LIGSASKVEFDQIAGDVIEDEDLSLRVAIEQVLGCEGDLGQGTGGDAAGAGEGGAGGYEWFVHWKSLS
jgi:hypothetical protein